MRPALLLSILLPLLSYAQIIDGEPIHHILEKDGIPPIYEPELVSAQEGQQFMSPNEQVLGIVGPKGTAVAYSTWHLDSHEIVNDIIDGIALAVTW